MEETGGLEDIELFYDLEPERDSGDACGRVFGGTVLSPAGDVPYGPKRLAVLSERSARAKQAAPDDDKMDKVEKKRPIAMDEPPILQGQIFGRFDGGYAYVLSLLIKEGLEMWIMGNFLLITSTIALALWIVAVGPTVTWFVDPNNEMDRGWHSMWQRVHSFFSATLSFVVVQTATELFLSAWKYSGVAPYESVGYLLVALTVFYGSLNVFRRLYAAQTGSRELF